LWNYRSTGEAIWCCPEEGSEKKSRRREFFLYLFHVCGSVVVRVVKVLGVGVTVEVGLHGVENLILWEWYGGWSGEGIGRVFGDAVDVGSDFGGKEVGKSDVTRP
jgi:hypothetical protein